MFSRTAKSIVKSLKSRQFHITEENLKHSRILRRTKKSRSVEVSSNVTINNSRRVGTEMLNFSNHQTDNGKNQTERLMETLYRLPIAEESSALNHPLLSSEIISKAGNACRGIRPYVRFSGGIGPDSTKICRWDCAIVAILEQFPGSTYPPFREHDVNVTPLAGISSKYRSIKIERRNKRISWDVVVTEGNSCQSSRQVLLKDDEGSVGGPTKKVGNIATLSEIRRGGAEKWTSWMIPATLRVNKPKSLREICSCDKRHIGQFPLKAFVGIANNISRRFLVNHVNHEHNNGIVALNRNSEKISRDVAEEENWIERASSKIKSVLSDLHAKMQRRSTTISDSYYSENVITVNEAIPVSDVLSDRMILFAPKDCDSKSSIRSKIEEFCARRNKSLQRRAEEDDICKKKERSCKTAGKKYQGKEKICLRKGIDCSEKKRRTNRRKVSCERRTSSSYDKESSSDCRENRKELSRERSCKEHKVPFDKRRTRKEELRVEVCGAGPRRISCERQRLKKDSCEKSDENRYRTSPCRKPKKRIKNKKCKEDTDARARESALCEGRKGRKGCEDRKKMNCKEEKREEKSDCPRIKEIEPCKKKECPPVTKAPDCPEK